MVLKEINVSVLSVATDLDLFVISFAYNYQATSSTGTTGANILTSPGFLPGAIRDIFALLGILVLVVKRVSILVSSARSGRLRVLYTRFVIPFLLSRAYEREGVETVNHLLENIAIGKLISSDEEQRKIGIKQLAGMPSTEHAFRALVVTLARETSKDLRRQIVRALKIHTDLN